MMVPTPAQDSVDKGNDAMNTTTASLGLSLAMILAAAATALAADARPTIGAADRVQGSVQASYRTDVRTIGADAALLFEDLLTTGEGARLLATLEDGTALTLGENARLEIDAFIYDPNQSGSKLLLNVVAGAFLFVGGQVEAAPDAEVEIRTPVATLGIRGTTVWGGPIEGGYGVLVLEGEVTVSTTGGDVTLNAGQATMIHDVNRGPYPPYGWTDDKIGEAVATISFEE